MVEKLVVGPITKGLRSGITPFNVDNDSFPTLINAYQWRQRVKRKRGTSLLCRIQRNLINISLGTTLNGATALAISLYANMGITGNQPNAQIIPGSVGIAVSAPDTSTFIDNGQGGFTVSGNGNAAASSINYSTGIVVLAFNTPLMCGASILMTTVNYYPSVPVMGLEDVLLNASQLPLTMAFDTIYSYLINRSVPFNAYNVTFYKNLPTGFYSGYTQKTTWTPFFWNGQNYQQFWTTNYQGAFWAKTGVKVPFTITNI